MKATDERRGFALALVVFMLFAATVAAMTGYQVISSEASLADGNENQDEALSAANAGMQRYIGEHIGIPAPATYAIGDASVTITPRRMARLADSADVYLLTSVATVTDPRYPTSPATRTTYQEAWLNRRPVKFVSAMMTTQPMLQLTGPVIVDGSVYYSVNAATDCPANDASGIGNIDSMGSTGTGTTGLNPVDPSGSAVRFRQIGTTAASVIAAAGVRWSVLNDPTFPIPYDGTWPNFASIPSDSFPVIRVSGNYTLDRDGRGALIVTGTFTTTNSHSWSGIILAGQVVTGSYSNGGGGSGTVIRGGLVSGLNGTVMGGTQTLHEFNVVYYPCWVRKANLALAYLVPISRSAWTF